MKKRDSTKPPRPFVKIRGLYRREHWYRLPYMDLYLNFN